MAGDGNDGAELGKAPLDFPAHFSKLHPPRVRGRTTVLSSGTNYGGNKKKGGENAREKLSGSYTALELDWKDKFNYRGELSLPRSRKHARNFVRA